MNYGMLQKFEDFYPIDDSNALVVAGNNYNELSQLWNINYRMKDGVVFIEEQRCTMTGKHLRLGNIFQNKLVYSDEWKIYQDGEFIREGMQPYCFEKGIVYHKNAMIYLNDEKIVEPPVDHIEFGRPTIYGNFIYYESRKDEAPSGWEIHRYDMNTNTSEFVRKGANPFCYNDVLFYSYWLKTEFETRYENITK